jgi:purine-nucleoside phosphorylase
MSSPSWGVKRTIRVGTCGALDPALAHGDLVVVGDALAEDGASRALGASELAEPDRALTGALAAGLAAEGSPARVVSTDLFYAPKSEDGGPPKARSDAWRRRGAAAVEMEAAALFELGRRLGLATACILAVSDTFKGGERRRITEASLAAAVERMGALAAAAFAGAQP